MTTAAVRGVVRYIGTGSADPPTDADLVKAFSARRDEAAFAEILRRHGSVVLGVCRRILSDTHAADDSFQAVFLVLARKIGTIRPPGLVGSWLYGVAVRTAKKAKVTETRRWRREMRHFMASRERERPEITSPEHAELRAVIDDELGQLPARLRAVVVLCDLGGKSRSEAARELGCPEGTLASRLAKARRILADRLTRRGVALPAAGLASLASPVSPALAANTLAAAVGTAVAAPAVTHLAEGVVRTMTANKLKLWAVSGLVLAVVAGGTVALSRGNPPAQPTGAPQPAAVVVKAPDINWKEIKTLETSGWLAGSVAYSADGKTLVVGGTGRVRAYDAATFQERWTADVDRESQHFAAVAFAHKGDAILATCSEGVRYIDAANGKLGGDIHRMPNSKPTAIGVFPDEVIDVDVNPKPVTRKMIFNGENGYHIKSWLLWPAVGGIDVAIGPKGSPRRPVGESPIAVDPKGRWVVMTSPVYQPTGKNELWAYSAGRGAGGEMMLGHKAVVTSAAWSADGKTIVTGDADGTVIVWDAATFKEKAKVGFDQRVAAVAVTADGKRFAVSVVRAVQKEGAGAGSYFERVYVLDSANPAKNAPALPVANDREVGGQFSGVAGLAFSPDGKSLAAAFCDFAHLLNSGELIGKVRVWSLNDPKPQPPAAVTTGWKDAAIEPLTHHAGPVDSVAFSPDGRMFVSGGADGKVLLWDTAKRTPQELGSVIPAGKRTAVAWSPDGKLVAATRDKVTGFFDPAKRQVVLNTPPLPGGKAVAFSPDGKWFAVHDGTRAAIRGRVAGLADTAVPTSIDVPVGDHPAFLAWSPDGSKLAVSSHQVVSGEFGIEVYSSGAWKATPLTGHKEKATAAAWSLDGKRIATGASDGHVIVWDATTFKEQHRVNVAGGRGNGGTVHSLAFAPDSVTLAAAVQFTEGKGPNRVIMLDAATGTQGDFMQTWAQLRSVAFSPDGKTLLGAYGIDREQLKPLMTPDELKAAGGIAVWQLGK